MNMRTESEIRAYIDGYNACFKQFCECFKGRKSINDAIKKYEPMCRAMGNGMYEDCETADKDQIDDIPTADVRENVKGKWIERKPVHLGKVIKGLGSIFVCSVCGEEVDCKPYNFCPNCGAQMRIEKQIFHDAIDNTPMAEDVFVGIKEKMHKVVDEFNREKEE